MEPLTYSPPQRRTLTAARSEFRQNFPELQQRFVLSETFVRVSHCGGTGMQPTVFVEASSKSRTRAQQWAAAQGSCLAGPTQ